MSAFVDTEKQIYVSPSVDHVLLVNWFKHLVANSGWRPNPCFQSNLNVVRLVAFNHQEASLCLIEAQEYVLSLAWFGKMASGNIPSNKRINILHLGVNIVSLNCSEDEVVIRIFWTVPLDTADFFGSSWICIDEQEFGRVDQDAVLVVTNFRFQQGDRKNSEESLVIFELEQAFVEQMMLSQFERIDKV